MIKLIDEESLLSFGETESKLFFEHFLGELFGVSCTNELKYFQSIVINSCSGKLEAAFVVVEVLVVPG